MAKHALAGAPGASSRPPRARIPLRQAALLSVSLAAVAPVAHAQNAWLGGTSGNWTDGPNWSLGIAPGAGGGGENDQAAIDNAPAARLDLSQLGGALFLNTLGIGGTAGSAGDLSIAVPSNGGFYSPIFPGAFALGTNGGTGTLTVDLTAGGTPSAAIVFGAGYAFGVGAGSAAQLNVLGIGLQGGTGNAQWLAIWADPANTTVFGDAGGTAQIAVSGAAAAIQAGAAGIALGSGAGSFGSMTIDNGGRGIFFADGSVSPQFIIGDSGGRGEVTVTGTGPDGTPSRVYFLQGQAVIGNGPGGVGVLTVTGGAQAISGPGPCTGGGGGNNGGGNNGGGNNGGSSGGNSKMADGSQPDPGKPELNKVVGTNDCASSGAPAIGLNGGSGTATVSGPGSIWYVTGRTPSSSDPNAPQIGAVGNLTVGGAGSTGVLTLADGGRVALGQGAFVADPNAGFLVSLTNFTTGLGTLSVAEPGASGTVNFGAPAGAAPVAPGFLEAAAIQFNDPNGRLVFNHTATDYTFAIPTSGPGSLQTLAGTTILTTPGAMAYTGPTLVDGGILRAGAVDVLSQGSQHSVGPAGQLDLAGFNQTVPGMTNAGLITMNPAPGAVPGTTLTVAGGNYVGQGGVIAINTVLAGDGAPSDRLVVNGGTATGDTILRVTNAGGTGALTAADGIQVVQAQNGGSTAAGAFRLDTRVAVGAFEYQLFRGGSTNANDWFLRSALIAVPGSTAAAVEVAPGVVAALPAPGAPAIPLYRPEVALYAPVPAIARQMGLATLGTLHERVGEEENLRGIAESRAYADGAWARAFGERVRNRWDGTVDSSATGNLIGLQAGFDILRRTTDSGYRDHAGIYVAYTDYNASRVSGFALGQQNLGVGRLLMSGPAVGAYWTHFGPSGWYLDAVAQVNWFDVKATSDFGTGLSTSGSGVTLSLEGGYPIRFGAGQRWQVEPQAQIIWQSVSVDRSRDAYSTVDWNEGSAWTGRLGARMQYTGRDEQGTLWQPYGKVNLWHAFAGSDRITFGSPAPIENRFGGTAVEVGGGVTARVNANTSFYAHADYRWSIDGGRARTSATQGAIGIRFNW